jgi:hypothetical protein
MRAASCRDSTQLRDMSKCTIDETRYKTFLHAASACPKRICVQEMNKMTPDSPPFMARLYQVALDKLFVQRLAERSGRALNNDTGGLEGGDLGVGVTLSSADNSTSVAHSPARRRRDTGDEADNGLVGGVVLLEEVGSVLLGSSTNLSNHDDTVCLAVLEEDLQAVDEVGSGEGVTADTDNERLTKAGLGSLVDSLVGEGSGAGDDTDATALVDEARHDADLALALGTVSAGGILLLFLGLCVRGR